MKKLLVVSDPPARPGYLPRLRFLCDYLVRKGYDVTLLTEEYQPLDFAHSYSIETIRMYSGGSMDWMLKTIWTLLTDWHDRVFARRAIQLSAIKNQNFDLVLCSSFSDFPLGAAYRIARQMDVPLLCDIRDLDEQVDDSRYQYKHQSRWLMPFRHLYRAIHIRRRNKVLRAASAITTVSPWHADFIRRYNSHVHVIYNGFDETQFYPQDMVAEQFTVTYIGSLFEWQKEALEKVQQVISLDMHTPQHNPIPHDQLGDAIRRSSIMLVLTNKHTHGMLTTKFYEALGCEKPVLCVPSDQGELAKLIAFTHAGIATDDMEEIRAFIAEKQQEWQQKGFTRQQTQHREEFSRETQCQQMEEIIKQYIS
ncbi:MAG: glycosyltransferase [Paludibacteraceae bacterium]|nr:glycosyltransferase [Paludibacteraceae bacterium]